MNTTPVMSDGGVDLTHGRLTWSADGRVSIRTPDGRIAVAGDGIAADLAALLEGGSASGSAIVARAERPIGVVHGAESGFGPDVDMANWNVVVDGRLIVKVIGTLGDGDRAAQLVRIILRHAPRAVPLLHGTVEISTSAGPRVVATVSEFLPASVDGWTWVVDEALDALENGTQSTWPRELGGLIATVHGALVSETAGEPTSEAEIARSAVDELHVLLAEDNDTAHRLRARAEALESALRSVPTTTAPTFAVHGDLHVGQVLRDSSGAMRLIDFDGDPQGGIHSHRADAAVDLAHLLVSLDLVGAVVAKRLGADLPEILVWCDHARSELLEGYRDAARRLGLAFLLDEARLPGLEARRLIREFTYARDFLPRWRYASDWAVTHRFPAAPDTKDVLWTPPDSAMT